MSRSQWKGPYVAYKNESIKKNLNSILSRSAEILPKLIGTKILVHNGKIFKEIIVTKEMVGYKAGEFSFTRAKFSFKKKKIKKK
jgi:small subunit ribosomal protein S19